MRCYDVYRYINYDDYVSAVSELSVPMSKVDVTRLSNFHKVLKNSVTIDENIVNEHANLKTGINLPKNDKDWEIANSFFHMELSIDDINTVSLDEVVNKFNETIYNYFRDNYGTVKNNKEKERKFNEKYKKSTKETTKEPQKSITKQYR